MTTIDVLRGARERLARGWCQGVPAKDASGAPIFAADERACAWCLHGSLIAQGSRAFGPVTLQELAVGDAWKALGREAFGQDAVIKWHDLFDWNDAPGRTQAEVLALVDATIARLEAA